MYRSHYQRQDCDPESYCIHGRRNFLYFAYAINQLPKDVSFSLITAMDPTEKEPVEKMLEAGIDVTLNPSRNTVFFENIYEEDQNKRKQRVLAKADPFTIRQLEHVEAKVYHLGSLLSDDFSPEVVAYLAGRVRFPSMCRAICAR